MDRIRSDWVQSLGTTDHFVPGKLSHKIHKKELEEKYSVSNAMYYAIFVTMLLTTAVLFIGMMQKRNLKPLTL